MVKTDHKVVLPPIWKIEFKRQFEMMAIDVLALPRTHNDSVAYLVALYHYSKWVSIRPLREKSVGRVAEAFEMQKGQMFTDDSANI